MEMETGMYRILTESRGYIATKAHKDMSAACGEGSFQMLLSGELSKMIVEEEFFPEKTEKDGADKAAWDQGAAICIGLPANPDTVVSDITEPVVGLAKANIEGVMTADSAYMGDVNSVKEKEEASGVNKTGKKAAPFEAAEALSSLETAENVKEGQTVQALPRWSNRIDGGITNGKNNAIAAEKDMNSYKQGMQIEPDTAPPDTLPGQPSPMNIADLEEITPKTAEKAEPYSQIGKEIQFQLEKKGPMEFTMQLEPKNLGEIDVKLKIKDGKLMIDIMAASAKTQALLSGQVDKLIMSLGLQNVLVERVQIDKPADFQAREGQWQGFAMNGETDLSHGRQQNQLKQQWGGRQNSSKTGNWQYGIDASFSKGAEYGAVGKTGFMRMDYII